MQKRPQLGEGDDIVVQGFHTGAIQPQVETASEDVNEPEMIWATT